MQIAQTIPADLWCEVIQHLTDKMCRFELETIALTSLTRYRAGTYIVYRVNKVLGVVPGEMFDNLDLIIIRENRRNQRDPFVCGKSVAYQPPPGWIIAVHEKAAGLTNARPSLE